VFLNSLLKGISILFNNVRLGLLFVVSYVFAVEQERKLKGKKASNNNLRIDFISNLKDLRFEQHLK
jgi:hypothetical protein